MSPGVILWRCANCATEHFPARLICPRCGAGEGSPVEVSAGVVEEVTTVHRAVGETADAPRELATVRLHGGQRVIAALERPLPGGTQVALRQESGAVYASPSEKK